VHEPSGFDLAIRRHFKTIWRLAWTAAAFGGAYAIEYVAVPAPDRPFVGFGLAVVVGLVFTWFARVGREAQHERGFIRIDLHGYELVPLWCAIGYGISVGGAWALLDELHALSHGESLIILLGAAGIVVGGGIARLSSGGKDYLRVDIAAGLVEFVGRGRTDSIPLDAVGTLAIVEYVSPHDKRYPSRRTKWYRLVSPALSETPDAYLFESVYPKSVESVRARLQPRLDRLRDASALRRVLAETPTIGTDFRAGPGLLETAQRAVADPEHRKRALWVLEGDPDPEIRRRARALASP
jgi:hypothetical protein